MAHKQVLSRTKAVRRRGVRAVVLAAVLGSAALSIAEHRPASAASNEGCVWVYWPGGGTWVCPPPPKPSGGGGGGGGGVIVMSLYYPGLNTSAPSPPDLSGWTNDARSTSTTTTTSIVECMLAWSGRAWVVSCPTTLPATASITVAERAPT